MHISVLGAGSWGTALALQLARAGNATQLWGRNAAEIREMQSLRRNARYLPDCMFPKNLHANPDLESVVNHAEDLLIVVPSHALRETVHHIQPFLRPTQRLIWATKGLEPHSALLPHEVVESILGKTYPLAVVSGPSFAKETGLGLPTAVTVASENAQLAYDHAQAFHYGVFRAYTSTDVIGVEVGGVCKNVLAIGVGLADGLGMGANTRALLITRGLSEMMRFGVALGAKKETLMGLAGLGDLMLTCTDNLSRNRRMGLLLAKGKSSLDAQAEIKQVVEGVRVSKELFDLSQKLGVEMPICEQIYRVLHEERAPYEAMRLLSERPLKAEY